MTRHFLRDDDLSPAENRRHAQKAIITWQLHASTQFPDEEAP